ncbi:V-set domain-containing T-cell activation inhibitor 1 isoform 1-T2 [Discoglossus pictus]
MGAAIGKIIFRIMIVVIILLLAAIALIIGIGVSGNTGMTVTTVYSIGLIGEDAILGCTFPPDLKQTNDIQWEKVDLSGTVYKYVNGKADLAGQNTAYKDRVSLFPNQLVTGNASLKLTKVKLTDAGLYKCIISNTNGKGEAKLSFKVGAFSPLTVTKISQNTLHCESPNWYPVPTVTWLNTSSGTPISNLSTTNLIPGLNSMQQVQSDLWNASEYVQYTCVIKNELAQATGDAMITASGVVTQTRLDVLSSSNSLSPPLILLCVLFLAVHQGTILR